MTLADTVLRTVQQNRLIPPHSVILVAVSGGPDSLTLLHVLHRLSSTLACRLHVATLDHGLRGRESADDVRFVQDIAQQWQLPFTAGHVDVKALALQTGQGIEAAARRARYDFLASTARQAGASHIAVAHHAGDQAETVLMHLLRGSGLAGLVGMSFRSPLPGHPDLALIRPLLATSRSEIEAYCCEHSLQPREDATNRDTTYMRNYIRWTTLPHLRKLNPRVERVLSQLAEIASVDEDYLNRQLQQTIAAGVTLTAGRALIPRKLFRELHPALQRRVMRWAATQLAGSAQEVGYAHITGAVAVGARGQVGALALLPGGLRLRVDYETLVVERREAEPPAPDFRLSHDQEISVAIPGVTPIPGQDWRLAADLAPVAGFHARLAVADGQSLILRTRRSGDVFAPLGLEGHTQKLKKWMIDHKVPQGARAAIPLLLADGEIAAILYGAAWPISQRFAVQDGARREVYLKAEKLPKSGV